MQTKQSFEYSAPPVGQFMYYSELLLPFSIDSGIGLDIENLSVNYNDDVWKSKFDQTRRMSVATKSKQKKVVSILVLITVMFTIVNIPSAISRIMSSPENKEKVSFQVSHTVYIQTVHGKMTT